MQDSLNKENYRPVSILPCFFKSYWKDYMQKIISKELYREFYGKQILKRFWKWVIGNDDPSHKIILNNNETASFNEEKILGIVLDSKLNFEFHIISLCKKAWQK